MNKDLLCEFIAIKPKGFRYYIWFYQSKVTSENGVFIGKGGWGKGGANTNIQCRDTEIESTIYSDTLQYS